MYRGENLSLSKLDNGIVEMCFESAGSVNTLDRKTLTEIAEALAVLQGAPDIKGLLMSSAKDAFIVGADITEFTEMFAGPEQALADAVTQVHATFSQVEDLPFPKVAAINGFALGGGLELALTCEYRVLADVARVGFPEVKLGIIPGYGGTIRAPRVMGCDNAVKWICTGKQAKAAEAMSLGIADAVVPVDELRQVALQTLDSAISGDLDYQARHAEKIAPLRLNDMERMMSFTAAKGLIAAQAGKDYPAPMAALAAVEEHSTLERDAATAVEIKHFVRMAFTDVAASLVGLFLNEQAVSKKARKSGKGYKATERAAVLGAGIMGGGIAYQSAVKSIPVLMKDIAQQGLDTGMTEAAQLLSKLVERGRLPAAKMAQSLNLIQPSLSYDGIDNAQVIVEAVVENTELKKKVLAECEQHIDSDAILCSNTSTICISDLATALQRPENFCGMHFFNPVHKMPLVEVIRGKQSSDEAIGRVMAYATALGKTAILVNDCPGFLVNRVLFPYLAAFNALVHEGVDYHQIDRVMERFGWPMGPAYLVDVVGVDTGVHAAGVLADAFPERMKVDYKTATEIMFENERLGQKNGKGFYQYVPDKRGRIKKTVDDEAHALVSAGKAIEMDDEAIVDRLMLPMCLEMIRCLDEGIVATPAEADMALIMGIGFPMFRGGVCRYIDTMGAQTFCDKVNAHADLGALYEPSATLAKMAGDGGSFY